MFAPIGLWRKRWRLEILDRQPVDRGTRRS
jgi:hypothetical protein